MKQSSSSTITRRSRAHASSAPTPRAEPFNAATNTIPLSFIRNSISCSSSNSVAPHSGVRRMAGRSADDRPIPAAVANADAPTRPVTGLSSPPSCSQSMAAWLMNRCGWVPVRTTQRIEGSSWMLSK
ncbi:hypothetical protein [Nakamurella endophytica]|uniref:Uncharacterized protein n=1 Tax=Nakamurella endophytica TaxID=1748367 RepID=A0A917SS33_9ACTN|nr:hypothetical protein [Nakamurella endophytica]GGL92229.1 hypothetical protein GCM10011594_09980 [Nakamurella endophytica]